MGMRPYSDQSRRWVLLFAAIVLFLLLGPAPVWSAAPVQLLGAPTITPTPVTVGTDATVQFGLKALTAGLLSLTHFPQLRRQSYVISARHSENQAIFSTTFSIIFGLLGMRIFIL